MFLAFITLAVALSISAVAIYYSVAGLVAIFASAAIPIMIMGGTLEIGKLVTAVWLHKYWTRATWWLRTYLALAVVVLMLITSMGIFGFLSKAHIEQTSAGEESFAQVERLTTEIARQNEVVARAELKINSLQTSGTGSDANVQSQIDKEQERIDSAYARIQPAIDEQNKIIGSQAKLYQDELDRIDTAMQTVVGYIDSGDKENYKKAQAIIGVKPDGAFGSGSTRAYTAWKDAKNTERQVLLTNIQQATNNPQARAAAAEIKRLRTTVETQIAESNKLINRLRANIGKTDKAADIDAQVDEQTARIKTANTEIDTLTEEKYKLEGEYRKLEAEVGPIKYIAEFIYGEQADKNMLEKAVTWVIVIIIFVFDPLAVLLLIASQYTFEWYRKDREGNNNDDESNRINDEPPEEEGSGSNHSGGTDTDSGGTSNNNGTITDDDRATGADDVTRAVADALAIERARAQRIIENVPPTFTNAESNDASTDDSMGESLPGQTISTDDEGHSILEQTEVQPDGLTPEQIAEPYINVAPNYEADDGPLTDDQVHQIKAQLSIPDTKNRMFYPEELELKKSLKSSEELKREQEYDLKEQDANFQVNKTTWKEANPAQTLKHYKNLYVRGVIDSLPWEKSAKADNYIAEEGYRQNAEQNETTLFNRLRSKQ